MKSLTMTCVYLNPLKYVRTPPYIGQLTVVPVSGVLIVEVSLYRTAHCGPSSVLIIEVTLYRTAHCGPSGVLIIEVALCMYIKR